MTARQHQWEDHGHGIFCDVCLSPLVPDGDTCPGLAGRDLPDRYKPPTPSPTEPTRGADMERFDPVKVPGDWTYFIYKGPQTTLHRWLKVEDSPNPQKPHRVTIRERRAGDAEFEGQYHQDAVIDLTDAGLKVFAYALLRRVGER